MIIKYAFLFLALTILQLVLPTSVLAQAYGEGTYGSGVYGGDSTPPDTDPPTTPGTPSTTTPTSDTTPSWTWTASTDAGSGLASPPYTVEWSQASDFGSGVTTSTAATNSFTHSSALAAGTWYVRVKAEDASNNESSYSSNGTVVIDTTAPSDPGTPTTTTPTNSTTQNWSWTASTDAGSGILNYAWRVVTNVGEAVTNSTTATASAITSLTEGIYTFFVKAINNALLESNETSSSVTVDETAPGISLTTYSPDPTNDTTPTLTGTATDNLTNLTAIEYRVGSGSWTTCSADDGTIDETTEAFSCDVSTLAQGTHTIEVRATDSANNTTSGGAVGSDSLTVDTAAPTISLTEYTPDPTTDVTPTLTGTATDALTALTAIQFQVDGGSWTACTADDGAINETSEAFSCTLPIQADGAHTVNVRATDNASNTTSGGGLGSDSFTIATTAPGILLDALTPDPHNDPTPTFTGTAVSDPAELQSIEFQVDSGSWTACTADDGTIDETTEAFSCTTPALSNGEHTINVRATDTAANTTSGEAIGTDTFTIDTVAPTISLTAYTPDPTNDSTPTLTGTATDATSALTAIQFQVDSGSWTTCTADDGTIDELSETFSCTTSALTSGSHTVNVRATDSATNTTGAGIGTDTFTVDVTAPTISLTAISPDPTTDPTPTITGTATDALTALTAIQYQIDEGSWTACTADDGTIDELSETFSCTLTELADGSYSVSVRATDSLSNTTSGDSLGTDNFDVDAPDPSPTPTPTPTPAPSNDDDDDDRSSSSSRTSSRSSECRSPKPDSTPDLFQINASNTSVKLFFTPSSGNRDKYFVMYGLMPGAEQYGFEFPNTSNGVISVDIHELAPGTVYYFKVQARNGCTAGDWSNELAVRTGQRFPTYRWSSAGQIITTAVTNRVNPGAITNNTTNFSNTQLNQVEEPVLSPTVTTPPTIPIATPRPVAPQPQAPAPTPAPQQQNNPGFFERVGNFIKNIF